MQINRLLSAGLIAALVATTATAQSLTGRFVDYNGAPVSNVNVILSNGAPLGTTDATGNFLITGLRNRVYTIQCDPHNNFLDAQQFDFAVSGASNLGTIVLQPAFPVTARFLGPNGQPLLGVNMNAYTTNGSVKLYTPHDGSDALGNVVIGVPVNQNLIIRALPPVGSGLVPWQVQMTVTGPTALGTKTLPTGYTITGTAVDKINNLPIAGAEIITTDMLTGELVPQVNKLTNALGAFSALVPFGAYQMNIAPPAGNLHAGRELMGIPVLNQNFNLGLVGLERGFLLSGTVSGPSGPVAADIDIYTTDNFKLYTPNDNTSATGLFSVVVPVGTYQVRVDPLVAQGLVGTRTGNFTVTTSSSVGSIVLAPGVQMNTTVVDYNGQPVPHPNVNFTNPTTGQNVVIAGDIGDATGHVHAIVPLGTWNINISGPQGSLAHDLSMPNTVITGPITSTVVMQRKSLMMDMKVFAPGIVLSVANGSVMPIDWSFTNPDAVDHLAVVDGGIALPTGAFLPWIPNIPFNFPANFSMLLQFQMPMPVVPASLLGRMLKFMVRFKDPVTDAIIETAYINYVPL